MECFRSEDDKHGTPDYHRVRVTGYSVQPSGVMVDVEGLGTYRVELPADIDKHANLTDAQIVVLDLMNAKEVRKDVARILAKDPKAVFLPKNDKKSA